jgi:hypothetical protein
LVLFELGERSAGRFCRSGVARGGEQLRRVETGADVRPTLSSQAR